MVDVVRSPVDPLLKQAADVVAQKLGLNAGDVTISRDPYDADKERLQRAYGPGETDTAPTERQSVDLYFTIHKQGIDVNQVEATQEIRTGFSQKIPAVNRVSQMVPIENVVENTVKDLNEAIEGTSFNRELLKSPTFDATLAKEHRVHQHMLEKMRTNAYGLEGSVVISAKKGEDTTAKLKEIAEYIKGPEFRAVLEARLEKYVKIKLEKEGKKPEEIAAQLKDVKEKFAALKIEPDTKEKLDEVRFTIRSQQQIDELAKHNGETYNQPANPDELRASNPMHLLSTKEIPATETSPAIPAELNKAIGRSMQKLPHYIELAGTVDVRNLIGKEMTRLFKEDLKDKPEKQALLKKVANSPIFLNHPNFQGAQQVGDAPPEPDFRRVVGANNTLEMKLTLTHVPDQKYPVQALLEDIINAPTVESPSMDRMVDAAIATTPPTLAAAGAAIACPPNEIAVAGAGAVGAAEGAAAVAGAACVAPEAIAGAQEQIAAQEQNAQAHVKLASEETKRWQEAIGRTLGTFSDKAAQTPANFGLGA